VHKCGETQGGEPLYNLYRKAEALQEDAQRPTEDLLDLARRRGEQGSGLVLLLGPVTGLLNVT
jgi:hypothetical protein